jgi:hypothetical protein
LRYGFNLRFLEKARKLAESEGVALNQLINVAVARKLSAPRTEDYFSQRAARANLPKALIPIRRLADSFRIHESAMA